MTYAQIAGEQLAWFAANGMTPKGCMRALGRPHDKSGWLSVFKTLLSEARRINPPTPHITRPVSPRVA